MSETEWNASLELRNRYSANDQVRKAGTFVRELFSEEDRLGIIRLKESQYYRPGLNTAGLISSLNELF